MDVVFRPAGRRLALLGIVIGIGAFAFLGVRGLYETTEGRYAEVAREMVERGNFFDPSLAGRPHWSKPPMAYWAIAGGLAVGGFDAAGARLPGAIAFVVTTLAVAGIGSALFDRRAGWLAGLVYASSPFVVVGAQVVSTDVYLAMWETLAVLAWVRALRAPGPTEARRWTRAMWIAFGGGFLTKGPVALLPLTAIAAARLLDRRRGRPAPARLFEPVGVLAFALLGPAWYAIEMSHHAGLFGYLLGDELVGRVASAEYHRNPQWWAPFALYLPILALGAGAWSAWGARLVAGERLFDPRRWKDRIAAGGPAAFLLLWLALPLAVLSLAESRLPLYVLPLMAPIAVAIGRWIDRAEGPSIRARIPIVAVTSALVLAGLRVTAARRPNDLDMATLHARAEAAVGTRARYRVYGPDRLYGFQFYSDAGEEVLRVSPSGEESWADRSLPEALLEARSGGDPRPLVFLVRSKEEPEIGRALAVAGVRHETVALGPRRRGVVVRPAAGEAGFEPATTALTARRSAD